MSIKSKNFQVSVCSRCLTLLPLDGLAVEADEVQQGVLRVECLDRAACEERNRGVRCGS